MDNLVFTVEKPGLLTTIQDKGRIGFQKEGMVVAGAMDAFASQIANLLVGNRSTAAVLEVTLLGPTLQIHQETVFAVCGADLSAHLDQSPVPLWKSQRVQAGQRLSFGRRNSGARAYLAVAGGFDVPLVLGSRATFLRGGFGGLEGRSLRSGDKLHAEKRTSQMPLAAVAGRSLVPAEVPRYSDPATVRVIRGPQQAAFSEAGWATFLNSHYTISPQSDRMGCRLEGPPIAYRSADQAAMITDSTPQGTIQVPADGRPIVLMADRQTTGGYPQIATVITVDLPLIAQMPPGGRLLFLESSVETAQDLLTNQTAFLNVLEISQYFFS